MKRLIVVKGKALAATIKQDDRLLEYRATHEGFTATGDTIHEACDHLTTHMREYA